MTGLLAGLEQSGNYTESDAIDRARSYFLVNAMVNNTLTFALGPMFIKSDEEAVECPDIQETDHGANGNAENCGIVQDEEQEIVAVNEQTSLIPSQAAGIATKVCIRTHNAFQAEFNRLPIWIQSLLYLLYQFFDAPLIDTIFGA